MLRACTPLSVVLLVLVLVDGVMGYALRVRYAKA